MRYVSPLSACVFKGKFFYCRAPCRLSKHNDAAACIPAQNRQPRDPPKAFCPAFFPGVNQGPPVPKPYCLSVKVKGIHIPGTECTIAAPNIKGPCGYSA